MSYELVKIQSDEGFSFAPGSNKLINFHFNEPSVIDFDKSYVDLNVTLNFTLNAATLTEANQVTGGNTDLEYVVNPAIAPLGLGGTIDYKPVALIRNCRFSSDSVPDMYVESRELNIYCHNKSLYTHDLGEHQKQALFGQGWSRLDATTNEIKNSVFLNKKTKGSEFSDVLPSDVIVPLSDLLSGDLGKMALYPSGLMGTQRLSLELEDRYNLVDVANLFNPISIEFEDGALPEMSDASSVKKTLNLPVNSLTYGINVGDSMLYVGMCIGIELTDSATPPVVTKEFAIITDINYTPSLGADQSDAFDELNKTGEVQLTLNKTLGQIFDYTIGTPKELKKLRLLPLSLEDMVTGTPSYTINRAELVLARRRLPPAMVTQYYQAVLREGMKFGVIDTTSWNRNNATESNEFFTLPANSYAVMNMTPTPLLYSTINNMTSYRLAINDVETTNRDVTMTNTITSALYKHKVISTLGACNEVCKSLEPDICKAMNGLSVSESVAYPVDTVPYTTDRVLLKLSIKSSTANMPLGTSYLYVKHDKVVNF